MAEQTYPSHMQLVDFNLQATGARNLPDANAAGRARRCAVYRGAAVALIVLSAMAGAAETDDSVAPRAAVTAAFSEHDPDSTIELNHSMWEGFLSKTVIFAGRSSQRLSRGHKRVWIGSRMRFGNDLPSRYENNRLVLGKFDDAHLELVREYRRALESVPQQLPLASLNRDEQLAYWLNLYNAHAVEHVAAHYPETTTEALRSAPGEEPAGVWHQRTLNVAGVSLSLVDIEREILFPIWDDSLVLYGLWQGAIGGPRLPQRAYTGDRVRPMLRKNAVEFVNSNRATDPDGDVVEVSLLYGWGKSLFDGPEAIRRHILGLVRPPFSGGIDDSQRVEIERYDWHLADLSGGSHHQGQWNHTAAFVNSLGPGSRAQAFASLAQLRDETHRDLPALSMNLLKNMQQFNDRSRKTRVTIRDCAGDGDCGIEADDEAGDG